MKALYNKKLKTSSIIIALLLISVSSFFFQSKRYEYFEDEITSYGVANNGNFMVFTYGYAQDVEIQDMMERFFVGTSISDSYKKTKKTVENIINAGIYNSDFYNAIVQYKTQEKETVWRDGNYFHNYLTVQKNERFEGWKAYIATIRDVHPPLYFVILNLFCSFFVDIFSKWPAFIINYFCIIGICIVLYRLANLDRLGHIEGILAVLFYGFTGGYIDTMYLFRPYALLTFFTILFYYLHIQLSRNNWNLNVCNRRLLIGVAVLGYLTQYYFLIFAFLTFITSICIMGLGGYRNEVKRYIFTFIKAAIIGIAIWPFSIIHILFGKRGVEVRNVSDTELLQSKLLGFAKIFVDDVYGRALFLLLIVICVILILLFRHRKYGRLTCFNTEWYMLLLPTSIYMIIVSVISPYSTSRYLMCVFPLLILMNLMILVRMCLCINNRKIQVIILTTYLLGCIICASNKRPADYFEISKTDKDILCSLQNENMECVFVYNTRNQYDSSVPEFAGYAKTLLIQGEKFDSIDKSDIVGDEIVVYVAGYDETKIKELCSTLDADGYDMIAQKHVAKVYKVYFN